MVVLQFGGVGRIIRDGEDMRAVYVEGQKVWQRAGPWMPQDLFADGERGVFYDFTQTDTLYQDAAGTVPVTDTDDPIGLIKDLSGNDFDMYQSVSTARGEYKDDGGGRVQLDKIDDNYSIDFTGTGGFEATWYQGSKEGLVVGKLSIPNGVWKIARNRPSSFPSNNVMGMIIVEGDVSPAMDAAIRQWFAGRGCGMDFGAMTSFAEAFRQRTDVIALDCAHWDTSSVTNFQFFAQGCSSLVILDTSTWDTSSVTNFVGLASGCTSLVTLDTSSWDTSSVNSFYTFVYNCSSLETLDISSWDMSSVTNFGNFAYNCSSLTTILVAPGKSFSTITSGNLSPAASPAFQNTNLTQESIDNILVNLETCAVNNGRFAQTGGSAPSAVGEAAINSLRNRGWTIIVTGGY